MRRISYPLNIRLFDGAAAPAGTAPTGEASPAAGEVQGESVVNAESQAATEEVTTPDPEKRKADYKALRNGEYKDLFDADVHEIINKRFKEQKTLEKQLGAMQPIIEMLADKYGIMNPTPEDIANALHNDTSLLEDEAMEKGLTVDQLKYQKQLERDAKLYRQEQESKAQSQALQETVSEWRRQETELKQLYPGFDLQACINDVERGQDFQAILKSTNNVKHAYNALYFDQILPSAIQTAAQKAAEATTKNIQSRAARPTENGVSSQAGVIVTNNVDSLSPADILKMAERAKKGERIDFRPR